MIPLKNRKIVLIGGAGFIGHHLALALSKAGARVDIIDSLQVNNLFAFSAASSEVVNRELSLYFINQRLELLRKANISVHIQDARDYHALSPLLSALQPQVVIHLAAVAHAGRSNKNPHSTFDHSLRTLENALDASRGNIEHFIYFSSSMVYGNFEEDTVTEETPCNPLGIYGALKFSGEKIVIAYNQVFDLPYTIIRPSALYGERCVSRRVGQVFIENALKGLKIAIHGDGSDRLDFTYIDDLTQGTLCVLKSEKAINQTFNVTYGESRTVSEMLNILKEHFPEVVVKNRPRDRLIPSRGTLSVKKAREMLGYSPECPIEKGFVKYIKWYKSLPASISIS